MLLSHAIYANDLEDLDKLAKPIFTLIENGEVESLATKAMGTSSISDYISKSDMQQLDSQFSTILNVIGNYNSYKLLHEQGIEGIFWSRWYIVNFDRQPILITMEFYKAKSDWNFHSIGINTSLDDYMESGAEYRIGKMGQSTP